ncbi:MAG: xanthine dehydrogenase family protein molybdopterin-binding subunit [Gammaproteobacteria bacterium]|nr:xanthine dehydrogenase family protein molybdopterin-binding subunit [Gammaproteobacteria bacterium]
MNNPVNLSRRQFVAGTVSTGGGLLLGIAIGGCDQSSSGKALLRKIAAENPASADIGFLPSVFLRITPDDKVTIMLPSSEMGQGVATALPMLIAEELAAQWNKIEIQFAPAHKAFANPNHSRQLTGGSQSIRGFWQPLREAGAAAREMLIQAAALTWQVDRQECSARQSTVWHKATDRHLRFGELVDKAASLDVPDKVVLKSPQQFTLIGQPQPRLDIPHKVTGEAVFGIDVQIPDMLIACVARSPVLGAKLKSFDAGAAKTIAGVREVIAIDSGVAVVASHFWAAKKGCEALQIQWQASEHASLSSQSINSDFKAQVDNAKTVRTIGDVEKALASGSKRINAIYEAPYLAHACMEPMNCTAHVQDDRCDVWVPTQAQGASQAVAAKITGLATDQVFVHTTYLGGGFGRRGETDFVADAVQIAKTVNQPVKVLWTREQDTQHDFYRPASYNQLQAAVNDDGWPVAWSHAMVSQSILKRLVPLPAILLRGVDPTSIEGTAHLPYTLPNFQLRYAMAPSPVPVGFWRSVGHSQNGFIVESFLDEIAVLGGKDPLELRLYLLKDQPRYLQVLQLAADKARWHEPPPEGRHRGIAIVHSFDSYVAQVAEISLTGKPGAQSVRVHKMVCAVDCGIIVNPDIVTAQVESAVIYGLTAALYGTISFADGRVQQSNFHDYPLLRQHESPVIEVHLMNNTEAPGGVGEIGVPPVAPAVANAVFAATGKPVRRLPIQL